MAEELKACPFCGRIPKTSHRPESEASGGGLVAFVVCYCGGYASTAHQMGHAETVQAAIAEVVEKWNTSAQLPSQGGEAVAIVCGSQVQWLPGAGKVPDRSPLYTHPADQVAEGVVVSRELLERAAHWLEMHSSGGGSTEYFCAEELRALLAKSEGVKK